MYKDIKLIDKGMYYTRMHIKYFQEKKCSVYSDTCPKEAKGFKKLITGVFFLFLLNMMLPFL